MYAYMNVCTHVYKYVRTLYVVMYVHMHMFNEDDYIPVNNSLLLFIDVF